MTPTLLHAVARKADALTPDSDLLARFAHDADHAAFEEIVRRHGPLVWAVCRQARPDHADAEDAFQAVFLALVRSAAGIRDGRALPAWLHGAAVRVCARARRQSARQKVRDRAAARSESDRPVSDDAWGQLIATVHEEVQRLPEAERTAFVLCDLEGVSQPDAAARLGCPLGSVSGRLCKARQRLLERLTARGVAPAAVVGVGLTAGAASALPAKLFDVAKTFPGSSAAASEVAVRLACAIVGGVAMRVKVMAAVVVAAMGVTGGAVLLSKADAQPPEFTKEIKDLLPADGQPPGVGGGMPPGAGGPPPGAGGGLGIPPGIGGPGMPSGGAPGGLGGPGGMGGFAVSSAPLEYKFVDVKSDRKVFEQTVTQQAKDGWEYVGSERFAGPVWNTGVGATPGDLTLVFKKRTGASGGFTGGGGGFGGGPGGGGGGNTGLWGNWGGRDGVEVRTFALKHAVAADVAAALGKGLANAVKAAVPDAATNRLLVVADAAAMKTVTRLVEEIDARPGKGMGGGPPGGSGPGGAMPGALPDPGSGGMSGGPGAPPRPAGALTVITLKHAAAAETAPLLKQVFPAAEVTADTRTNQLIVRADAKTLEELQALLAKLDVQVSRSK